MNSNDCTYANINQSLLVIASILRQRLLSILTIAGIQKLQNLFNQSYGVHIMPYHTTSYYQPQGWTHRHTHTHTSRTGSISRNQVHTILWPACTCMVYTSRHKFMQEKPNREIQYYYGIIIQPQLIVVTQVVIRLQWQGKVP